MGETKAPIGVVLAGGAGRRIGGGKAIVELNGVPLLAYPVAALRVVLGEVVVVAKRETALPTLPGVAVLTEPDEPQHPLTGLVHALERADGCAILACAGDLPFVTSGVVRALVAADAGDAPAVVPRVGGRLQPLLAVYGPAARAPLAAALVEPGRLRSLRKIVAGLGPRILELDDERPFFNVNAPEDLLTAAAMIDSGDGDTSAPAAPDP